jgi:hypothetical protein
MTNELLYRIYCSIGWNSRLSPIKRLVSKWACPIGAEEHFWHDGCPYCDLNEIMDRCPACSKPNGCLDQHGGCCSKDCYDWMVDTYC